ncbi:631_t:CDS:2, partial [Diversispora eburnea]
KHKFIWEIKMGELKEKRVHLDDTELYHFKLDAKQFSQGHDTILVYSKDGEKWKPNFLEKKLNLGDFKFQDEKGRHYKRVTLRKTGSNSARADRPNMFYPIKAPDGEAVFPMRRTARGVEDEGSATAKKEIKKLFPEIEPFQTPKPESLLKRIIEIATNESDVVLDYFAVEKSMFATHSGIICIADHALNGKLAKLVATQLEYDYQSDNEHFCGKKGDVLLAVVDGMLTEGLLNFLLNSMEENKFLEIAALAVDPELENKKFNNVKIEKSKEELDKREKELREKLEETKKREKSVEN